MGRARSCLSTHFRIHREGMCGQKHISGRTLIAGAHHHALGISEEHFKHVCWASWGRRWQKCFVACTCRSRTIDSAKPIDSKHTHWNTESAWKEQDLAGVLILGFTAKACVGKNTCLSISERFCILGQKTHSLGKILLQHAACQSVTSKGLNGQLQLQGSEALTTLNSSHSSLAFQTQHRMLSWGTS